MPDESALLLDTLRLADAPDQAGLGARWAAADPHGVADLARIEGASQWLLRRLERLGLLPAAPAPMLAGLRATAREQLAAGMLVDTAAEDVLRALERLGAPVMLIKGTARRALADRYPYADARGTVDVDLLLPERVMPNAWDALREAGWTPGAGAATPDGHFHAPPLVGQAGITIELHASLARTIPAAEAWRRAEDGAQAHQWRGIAVRVPGAGELFWHAVIHGTTTDWDGFRLRYFLDAAVILASGESLDWGAIAHRVAGREAGEAAVARAWIRAACDVAGVAVPREVSGPTAPFDIGRQLEWRLAVVRRFTRRSVRGRLIEEAARADLGRPLATSPDGASPLIRARRLLGGSAARVMYGAWRGGS